MTTDQPHTFIADHGFIITALMVLMFIACIAYTVYVMILDIRETRERALADEEWSGTMRSSTHDGGTE